MLSSAPDFWPLFWTVTGAGAALTVLACIAAAAGPAWPARSRPGTVHHLPRPHLPAAHHRKAA